MRREYTILLTAAFLSVSSLFASGGPDGKEKIEPSNSKIALIVRCEAGLLDRLWAVHSLPSNLGVLDEEVLYQFLKSRPAPNEATLRGLRFLKNEIFGALQNQADAPPNLTATMIEIYKDQGQDFVTRDYAIQHLVTWYAQGALDSPDARTQIRAILRESVAKNDSIAGTALLGMHRLAKNDPAFTAYEIEDAALKMVQSPEANLASRITAIQVCAERGIAGAAPAIETLAQARGQIALQITAIAALGKLGGPGNLGFLRKTAAENPALRPAASSALHQIGNAVASQHPFELR
jgi:hypothetical protein